MIPFCLDANIFITAWGNMYPIDVFPSLWEQLSEKRENILLIKPIYDELKSGKDKLFDWITAEVFKTPSLSTEMEALALQLESDYEVIPQSKGASSNDIKVIAYAKVSETTVVTFEKIQIQKPTKKSNYKIPLICSEKAVPCIEFVPFLKKIGIEI